MTGESGADVYQKLTLGDSVVKTALHNKEKKAFMQVKKTAMSRAGMNSQDVDTETWSDVKRRMHACAVLVTCTPPCPLPPPIPRQNVAKLFRRKANLFKTCWPPSHPKKKHLSPSPSLSMVRAKRTRNGLHLYVRRRTLDSRFKELSFACTRFYSWLWQNELCPIQRTQRWRHTFHTIDTGRRPVDILRWVS